MADDRPIAVQFSDLRGFSSFTAQHGDQEAYRIARRFVELVGSEVERHEGHLLKTYGDGVMTSFENPAQAVTCAVSMQSTLCDEYCGEDDETDAIISAGIGLSWGTPIRTGDDLFGHAVNLAKRLADEAKGGQIVASSDLVDVAGTPQGFSFRDMGDRELKGVGEYRLYEILWRPEIARLQTPDDRMDVILTDDQKVIVELGKAMKQHIGEVIQQLEKEAEGGDETGLARIIKRAVTRRVAKSLPTWMEWAQSRAGMGIEHNVQDVSAEIVNGALTLQLGNSKKALKFQPNEIDPASAHAFVEQLKQIQKSLRS